MYIIFIIRYNVITYFYVIYYTRPFSYKHVMHFEHAPATPLPESSTSTFKFLSSLSLYLSLYINIYNQYINHSYICMYVYAHINIHSYLYTLMYIYMSDFMHLKSLGLAHRKKGNHRRFPSWLSKVPLGESQQTCIIHQ